MLLSDDEELPPVHTKAPPWIITFADLMSLLMCFFVLLLAYSEMDAKKFEQVAGSLQQSLGNMTNESAGQAPIPLPVPPLDPADQTDPNPEDAAQSQAAKALVEKLNQAAAQTKAEAEQLAQHLQGPMERGELEVETEGQNIIVRLREQGSFDSGSADLNPQAKATLATIEQVLRSKSGRVQVFGHTDDIPIKTARFRSNWELSAVRAVAVAEALMASGAVASGRFEVTGFAETHPLVSNDSPANRARNRRVEIVINQDSNLSLTEQEKRLLEQTQSKKISQPQPVRPKGKPALPEHIF